MLYLRCTRLAYGQFMYNVQLQATVHVRSWSSAEAHTFWQHSPWITCMQMHSAGHRLTTAHLEQCSVHTTTQCLLPNTVTAVECASRMLYMCEIDSRNRAINPVFVKRNQTSIPFLHGALRAMYRQTDRKKER